MFCPAITYLFIYCTRAVSEGRTALWAVWVGRCPEPQGKGLSISEAAGTTVPIPWESKGVFLNQGRAVPWEAPQTQVGPEIGRDVRGRACAQGSRWGAGRAAEGGEPAHLPAEPSPGPSPAVPHLVRAGQVQKGNSAAASGKGALGRRQRDSALSPHPAGSCRPAGGSLSLSLGPHAAPLWPFWLSYQHWVSVLQRGPTLGLPPAWPQLRQHGGWFPRLCLQLRSPHRPGREEPDWPAGPPGLSSPGQGCRAPGALTPHPRAPFRGCPCPPGWPLPRHRAWCPSLRKGLCLPPAKIPPCPVPARPSHSVPRDPPGHRGAQ